MPVDPLTLETAFAGVYAVGDVASVGTPKAGVFAEGQASVVAEAISATLRGVGASRTYDGHGLCYLDMGAAGVAKVDVTFRSGETPTGSLIGPSTDLIREKTEFGRSRIARWFGPPDQG